MMKVTATAILLCLVLFMFPGFAQTDYKGWDVAKEKEHAKRREDTSKRDKELFDADKELIKELSTRPFTFGVFRVPPYDLIGTRSFRGAGNIRSELAWRDQFILGNAFYNLRSPVNERFVGDKANEVFFHILVLSREKLKPDGSNGFGQVLSRNHPHIVGQGQFTTGTAVIDYLAFQTADRNAYAIVNMRLFDLRAGRVILNAPQKDGTLRSMQIDAPLMASTEVKDYDAKLLKQLEVVKFFDSRDGT